MESKQDHSINCLQYWYYFAYFNQLFDFQVIFVDNGMKNSLPLHDSIQPQTLASRVFESIKSGIIDGHLAQGCKIVESDLALKYGISRGPLREAIHRLEQIKLVVRVTIAG